LLTALSVLLLYVKREQSWKKLCNFTFDACIGCKKRTALLVLSSLIWILLFWGFAHEFCQVVLIQIFSSFSFLKIFILTGYFGVFSYEFLDLYHWNLFFCVLITFFMIWNWTFRCSVVNWKSSFGYATHFLLTWQKSLKNFFTTFILNTSSL
jgi:hypothetical protein